MHKYKKIHFCNESVPEMGLILSKIYERVLSAGPWYIIHSLDSDVMLSLQYFMLYKDILKNQNTEWTTA